MAYSEDVNINLNVLTGTIAGITAIAGGMSALTSSFGAIGTAAGESFGVLDGLLLSSTALITTFAVKSAEAFGEFEQGMKIVQMVSGQTGSAMNELTTKANEMSVAYRTSIGDITEGLQTLGRAGLSSANEQLEVLESGLQTAKLEGRNLNGVLEEIIQNTAMLGGDLKSVNFGEQAEYLNSLLVGTSMTAPITSHDISQTLQYAGGTAAAAGANLENKDKLEDLMGTVAAFAQKGVSGSMAGTALRAFFTKPASQDASVTEGLSRIGLSPEDLWEDGGESMKKVSDQIALIQKQMDKMHLSTMDQVEVWGKIVGPKMGQQMMKLDSSSIKDLTKDIHEAQSAEELAAGTLQTYTQKVSEMQQQSEQAFRDFGSKVVVFLTPVVEAITWILKALSHPVVNTAVFAAVGAVLAHGFRTAWSIATTVFRQIMSALTAATSEVATLNTMAGGSSAGFAKSASSVDFLNTKLAQTNSELAMMQAQFMKLNVSATGTSLMPLGIVGHGGKVPHNMIDYAPQDVLRIGGMRGTGQFFDKNDKEQFKAAYRDHLEKETQAKVEQGMKERQVAGPRGSVRYVKGGDGPDRSQYISESALRSQLTSKFALSEEEINSKTAAALKNSKGQLHSGLMSMTEKEYKSFMKDLRTASARVMDPKNYQKGGIYVNEDGSYTDAYHRDQRKHFNLKRQEDFEKEAEKEGGIHKRTVGGQTYYRTHKLYEPQSRMYETERTLQKEYQIRQFEDKRAEVRRRQRDLAQGKSGIGYGMRQTASKMNEKAFKLGEQAVNRYSNVLNRSRTSILRWTNQLDLSSPKVEKSMMSAIGSIEKELQTVPMTLEEALGRLGEITGLNAQELYEFLEASEVAQKALFDLGLVTSEGEAATIGHTRSVLLDTAATEADTASKAFSSLQNGVKTVVGYMGGPFMAAMMGITFVMQGIQASQQAWQNEMQEATDQLSEASDKMDEASEGIKELYSSENENISDIDAEKALDQQYANAYDAFSGSTNARDVDRNQLGDSTFMSEPDLRGEFDEATGQYKLLTEEEIAERNAAVEEISLSKDENVKALQENTLALQSATHAYAQGVLKKAKGFEDGTWGFNSFTAQATDKLGEWQEEIWNLGAYLVDYTRPFEDILKTGSDPQFSDAREGFLDSNSPVLTGSQKDENYEGSTEFAAIFAADTFRFGIDEGLKQFFGSDYDRIISLMSSMDSKMGVNGYDALKGYGQAMADMDSSKMAVAQISMKEDKPTWQRLAKQMFRYEQGGNFNRNALRDLTPQGRDRAKGVAGLSRGGMKQLKVQDKNVDNTVKKLMNLTDGKLSYQNVLALGQLQQLQDMYQVANETVAPGIMQTVQGVYSNISATNVAGANAGSASEGAGSAAANAAAIAAFLGAQAQSTAEKSAYEEWKRDENAPDTINGVKIENQDDFVRAISKGGDEGNKYQQKVFESLAGSGWSVNHPGASSEMIKDNAQRIVRDSGLMDSAASYQDKLNTVTRPLVDYATGATLAAYGASDIGEYGSRNKGSGGGSGGGDGGGGSGKGSDDTGKKKDRVDLVLCNKKEIPKLNVNLFKKPPNFTVLNKNFKLRDIKINSQDKPKAIMNAIKNGIIETQKRMDPKIIQDEAAEYNPVEATDGSSTPSGTTKTTT